MRGIGGTRVRAAAGALAAACALAPPAAAAPLAPVTCAPDPAAAARFPVLLIHGTGVDARQNWSWGYAKDLRERGHGVCTIDLPERGQVDLQDSVHSTVNAIRETFARGGGRRLAIVGHSQGASQAMLALRTWPELGPLVDDVVGLAGAYDRGSQSIRDQCESERCTPPFWQFATGSRLLGALAARPLPPEVSFTAIGTLPDDRITPQPEANELPGARSVQIQDVCPGRRFADGYDHIYLAADAVAHALAIDALGHPGPADPARIAASVCALQMYPGADAAALALIVPELLAGGGAPPAGLVDGEPELRCPWADGCAGVREPLAAAGLVWRRVPAGGRLVLRLRLRGTLELRLRFVRAGGRRAALGASRPRTLTPGSYRLWLPARACRAGECRRLRAGRYRAVVETRGRGGGEWVPARALRLRIVRRG